MTHVDWDKFKTSPTPNKVAHIAFLVDRSGSMESIRSDVIGGFNQFIRDQKALPGSCLITVHQFDSDAFDTLFDAKEVKLVREATMTDFTPRGATPLLDAVGRCISLMDHRVSLHPNEKPVVVIITDGLENASREYRRDMIREQITSREVAGWVFTYLGANVDAFSEAARLGINRANTQNFVPDSRGTHAVYSSVSAAVGSTRTRMAAGQSVDATDFYAETDNTAQEDYEQRQGSSNETS